MTPSIEPVVAKFVPHNANVTTGSTNLPQGVVHVFRESFGEPSEAEAPKISAASDADGIIIGVLAVPSWMKPSDFLAFVAPAAEGISHLRMIR